MAIIPVIIPLIPFKLISSQMNVTNIVTNEYSKSARNVAKVAMLQNALQYLIHFNSFLEFYHKIKFSIELCLRQILSTRTGCARLLN